VDLFQKSKQERIEELKKSRSNLPKMVYQQRKAIILKSLKE